MSKFMTFSAPVREVFADEHTYLDFSQLMLDTGSNQLKGNISKDEANEKIREMFHSILGTNKDSSKKEIRRALRRHKHDLFDVMEETLENMLVTGWQNDPFFMEFVEMRSVADGDTNEFVSEDETILTVGELSGNHHDIERQRLGIGSTFRVKTSWYGLKIYAEYELFMAGREDWARLTQKVYEAYDRYVTDMLHEAVMGAAEKVPATTQFNKSGALTPEYHDSFVELISDVATANGNAEVIVMGTRAALSKLTGMADVDWISNSMKEERHTTGRLGSFEGIRLVEIPQAFALNDTTKKLVANDKLMIMPAVDNKFVKMFNEGDAQIYESTDGTKQDKTIEYEYQMKFGIAVIIGRYFGTWTITTASVTPDQGGN